MLEAVGLLRALYRGERRELRDGVPLAQLTRAWYRRVHTANGAIVAKAYVVTVLVHLKRGLDSNDIFVDSSRAHRTFEDYLLSLAVFSVMRSEDRPVAFYSHRLCGMVRRSICPSPRLAENAYRARRSRHPRRCAHRREDGLTVSPLRAEEEKALKVLSRRRYALVPRIRIIDLLTEVNDWTGFADVFTHLEAGDPPSRSANTFFRPSKRPPWSKAFFASAPDQSWSKQRIRDTGFFTTEHG